MKLLLLPFYAAVYAMAMWLTQVYFAARILLFKPVFSKAPLTPKFVTQALVSYLLVGFLWGLVYDHYWPEDVSPNLALDVLVLVMYLSLLFAVLNVQVAAYATLISVAWDTIKILLALGFEVKIPHAFRWELATVGILLLRFYHWRKHHG